MTRILHVLDHSLPLHSGYTFRTASILEEQRRRGWETVHVTGVKQGKYAGPVERVEQWEFHRTPPPSVSGPGSGIREIIAGVNALGRRIEQLVPQLRPDIIHAHSPSLNGLAALRVARKTRLPFVYEIRAFWEDAAVDHGTASEGGLRYRATRALESYVMRRADVVTTICEGLRREIVARGVPATRVSVIPNAVNIEKFAESTPSPRIEPLAAQLELRGCRVLGFAGSFYQYEGLSLLLQALPAVLKRFPNVRILLVGGGPQESELKALSSRLGIESHVRFTGRVPHADVDRYYDLIDILVYPRMPMRLTEIVTPLKPLEAMAKGRMLVASDVGGHRELIEDGVTGRLFKAGSVDGLVEALTKALAAPEAERVAMLEAGRRFVATERTWQSSVARYEGVYRDAAAEAARRRA